MWTCGQSVIFESGREAEEEQDLGPLPKAPEAPASMAEVSNVRINTSVFLTEEEVQFCEAYGRLRQRQNEEGGTYDMKYTARSGADLHVQGVRGELALAKLLGRRVYKDVCADVCEAHCRNNANDEKKDVEWQGLKIDVKCARNRAPFGLLVTANKRRAPAGAYVLMVDHGGCRLTFVGASTGQEVFKVARKTTKWGKTYYAVPLADLGALADGQVNVEAQGCFFDLQDGKAVWAGK